MYLLSSAQQGSDPAFTFTTLLCTKPMTYGKFTKSLKQLLNSQVWGQAIVVTVRGEEGQTLAPVGIPGEMISPKQQYLYIDYKYAMWWCQSG